jgi:hypothetical protein
LGAQAAFDLEDQIIGHAQLQEGVVKRFDIALGLSLLSFMPLFGVEAAPLDSFRVLFGVSFSRGHGSFLRIVG